MNLNIVSLCYLSIFFTASAKIDLWSAIDGKQDLYSESVNHKQTKGHILRDFFKGRRKEGFVPSPLRDSQDASSDNSAVKTCTIVQKLDHFGSNQQTWQQTGGPMFVMIGGEAPADILWMTNGDWVKNARIYGAYLFQLEHRYFGRSHPTSDASTSNLQWLTTSQALSDLATFVTAIKADKPELQNSTVVVFGGSYPGNLAAWFRLKYPQIIAGAVASSAPVLAKVDFFEYLEVVGESLTAIGGSDCLTNVQDAFNTINASISSGSTAAFKELFSLCTDVDPGAANDLATFYQGIISIFQRFVQYDVMGPKSQVRALCTIMGDSTYGATTLDRLGYIVRKVYEKYNCVSISYQQLINTYKEASWSDDSVSDGSRGWLYMTCTEFGYFQSTDSKNQPFGMHESAIFDEKLCRELFGVNPEQIASGVTNTNSNYGAKKLAATNVVLPNGSIDPWHALGILKNLGTTTKAQYYSGGSHCYDMQSANQNDNLGVRQVRDVITQQLKNYLATGSRLQNMDQ